MRVEGLSMGFPWDFLMGEEVVGRLITQHTAQHVSGRGAPAEEVQLSSYKLLKEKERNQALY